MSTPDTPEAALAAALRVWLGDGDGYLILHSIADAQAAGILAALDGWTLVPDDVWEAMSDRAAERARYEAECTKAPRHHHSGKLYDDAKAAIAERIMLDDARRQ